MLVILEELDNTGKTTIAKMLTQYYKMQGKNVILAKELSTPPQVTKLFNYINGCLIR